MENVVRYDEFAHIFYIQMSDTVLSYDPNAKPNQFMQSLFDLAEFKRSVGESSKNLGHE